MHNPSAWSGIVSLAFAILIQTAVLAFWLGRLSQRVLTVEKAATDADGLSEKVTRLQVEMEHATKELASINSGMQGVQRQLANIATGRAGAFYQADKP